MSNYTFVVVLWLAGSTLGGCRQSPAGRLIAVPRYEPDGGSKCGIGKQVKRPLVVEWSAADRASLEARLGRGVVAVRAEGCEIEVLRQCTAPGSYAYVGLTRKNDRVVIANADELYAQLPIGAARLESKLARTGMLDVRTTLVGMLEAPMEQIQPHMLSGACDGATHLISGVQLGAFEFVAGGSGEIGAGVAIRGIGAGGRSKASEELLSADGDPKRCDGATLTDERPPDGCGALVRIELAPLGSLRAIRPDCPAGSRWQSGRCEVSETHCPPGSHAQGGRCVSESVDCPQGEAFVPEVGCATLTPPRYAPPRPTTRPKEGPDGYQDTSSNLLRVTPHRGKRADRPRPGRW